MYFVLVDELYQEKNKEIGGTNLNCLSTCQKVSENTHLGCSLTVKTLGYYCLQTVTSVA